MAFASDSSPPKKGKMNCWILEAYIHTKNVNKKKPLVQPIIN